MVIPFHVVMLLIFFYNNDNLYEISGTEMQTLVENVLKACKEEVVNETNIYTIIKGKIKTFLSILPQLSRIKDSLSYLRFKINLLIFFMI